MDRVIGAMMGSGVACIVAGVIGSLVDPHPSVAAFVIVSVVASVGGSLAGWRLAGKERGGAGPDANRA